MRAVAVALATLGLAACASAPRTAGKPPATGAVVAAPASSAHRPGRKVSPYAPAKEDPNKRGHYVAGGLYRPGESDRIPDFIPDVDAIPEPEVVDEPRSPVGNRPVYEVLGKEYRVMDDTRGYVEQGIASFYGEKFHGRRTSNLEVYDMLAFTAAHKTLPLPSFARVTNLDNGKSVIVRINDRGPFHDGRLIDLSYAAAVKLGINARGTGRVEVRALHPGDEALFASTATPAAPAMGAVRTRPGTATSGIDRLVAAIPATQAPVRAAAAEPPSAGAAGTGTPAAGSQYRYDLRKDGQAAGAEGFGRWMREREVRVATGRPGSSEPAGTAVPAPAPAASTDAVILQVASFAARENADRALATLREAGIGAARLEDGLANGRTVWRLRVGPLESARAPELTTRIAGLGFGTPRPVRD